MHVRQLSTCKDMDDANRVAEVNQFVYDQLCENRSFALDYMKQKQKSNSRFKTLLTTDPVLQYNDVHRLLAMVKTTDAQHRESGSIVSSKLSMRESQQFPKPKPAHIQYMDHGFECDYVGERLVNLLCSQFYSDTEKDFNSSGMREDFSANFHRLDLLFKELLGSCRESGNLLAEQLSKARGELAVVLYESAPPSGSSLWRRIKQLEMQLAAVRAQIERMHTAGEEAAQRRRSELAQVESLLHNGYGAAVKNVIQETLERLHAERDRLAAVAQFDGSQQAMWPFQTNAMARLKQCEDEKASCHAELGRVKGEINDCLARMESHISLLCDMKRRTGETDFDESLLRERVARCRDQITLIGENALLEQQLNEAIEKRVQSLLDESVESEMAMRSKEIASRVDDEVDKRLKATRLQLCEKFKHDTIELDETLRNDYNDKVKQQQQQEQISAGRVSLPSIEDKVHNYKHELDRIFDFSNPDGGTDHQWPADSMEHCKLSSDSSDFVDLGPYGSKLNAIICHTIDEMNKLYLSMQAQSKCITDFQHDTTITVNQATRFFTDIDYLRNGLDMESSKEVERAIKLFAKLERKVMALGVKLDDILGEKARPKRARSKKEEEALAHFKPISEARIKVIQAGNRCKRTIIRKLRMDTTEMNKILNPSQHRHINCDIIDRIQDHKKYAARHKAEMEFRLEYDVVTDLVLNLGNEYKAQFQMYGNALRKPRVLQQFDRDIERLLNDADGKINFSQSERTVSKSHPDPYPRDMYDNGWDDDPQYDAKMEALYKHFEPEIKNDYDSYTRIFNSIKKERPDDEDSEVEIIADNDDVIETITIE